MNRKCFHIISAIWIFTVVVPIVLAESFNGRPTETEMDELVTLGMECSHGVRERCFATQTSTNPTYSVSPPDFTGTNGGGWYLNTSMMQTLDSKAKALVTNYANMNTVYDGTTNIVMLSVTGLWVQLEIGDHTNQFTGTPAIGTNPPTYGDYPWRPYTNSLEERYQVLKACRYTKETFALKITNAAYRSAGGYVRDLWAYTYKNTNTEANVTAYYPSWEANFLGLEENWYYGSGPGSTNGWILYPYPQLDNQARRVSLSEAKMMAQKIFHYGVPLATPIWDGSEAIYWTNTVPILLSEWKCDENIGYGSREWIYAGECTLLHTAPGYMSTGIGEYDSGRAPSNTIYTNAAGTNYDEGATNEWGGGSGGGGGGGEGGEGGGGEGGEGGGGSGQYTNGFPTNYSWQAQEYTEGWQWFWRAAKSHATYWGEIKENTNLTSEINIYAKVVVNKSPYGYIGSWINETAIFGSSNWDWDWYSPREWQSSLSCPYEESSGLSTSVFKQITDHFGWDGNYYSCVFGTDEEPPLAADGTFPNWSGTPVSGGSYIDNSGSVGKYSGMLFDPDLIWTLRNWNFNYCIDEY